MTEQKLNLFQFAAASVAQLGAAPAQVMRGRVLQPYVAAVPAHEVPDIVFTDTTSALCGAWGLVIGFEVRYSVNLKRVGRPALRENNLPTGLRFPCSAKS